MKEYVTQAIVLGVRGSGERDRVVRLFSKELGTLEARVVGGRRVLSKFASHLDPGNLAIVRLVKKNAYTVADVVSGERFTKLRRTTKEFARALALLSLLSRLLPREAPDLRLWHFVARSFATARVDVGATLKLLGYDPLHATCEVCGRKRPSYFVPATQSFICVLCRGKFGADGVLW
ncbi:MAG: DNA repair protein RecO [Candidatus Jorgensenbacteria bacterium]